MGIEFKREGALFVVAATGSYGSPALIETLDEIMALPDFPPGALLLLDLRTAQSLLKHSVADLRQIAEHFTLHAEAFQSRIALLVEGLARFGLMRMASVWVEQKGVDAQIFLEEDEAREWLLGAGPEQSPEGPRLS